MVSFEMIMIFVIQTLLCYRSEKRLWKLLPLVAGILLEAGGWAGVFLIPNPDPATATKVLWFVMTGIAVLGGATLGWFVYGIIRAVQKLIKG